MRTTAQITGTALAIITTAFTLSACDDATSNGASDATSGVAKPATSAAAFPAAGHSAVQCGTGPWGLAVIASTAKGNDFCPTALSVAGAYADERAKQSTGDIAVTVAAVRWVCGERAGNPNPYQECASQNESAEKVRLQS
ncbi:hypothetical protein ACWELJ_06930 [Nocardia sp. NPDC004582]